MKIAVYLSTFRTLKTASSVASMLTGWQKQGVEVLIAGATSGVFLDQGINIYLNGIAITKECSDDIDFVLSLGGDGTFLRAAHWVGNREIPIAGVNLGNLGYLTSFGYDELTHIPELLNSRNFDIESRTLLKVEFDEAVLSEGDDIWNYALNELAVIKQDTASMISIPVTLNGKELGTYSADGLIVSTPTGSTAYNLSVGGPVLQPTVDAWVLSPIADHSLTMRPMVISNSARLELTAVGRAHSFRVSVDGKSFILPAGSKVGVSKAPFVCKMVCKKGAMFSSTLMSKLLWGKGGR